MGTSRIGGRLAAILDAGHFAVTAETSPPDAADQAAVLARAGCLKGLADAVNVTDGSGRASAYVGARGGRHPGAPRHRAGAPVDRAGPQPPRHPGRFDRRGGARRAQHPVSSRRRYRRRRSTGSHAGPRPGQQGDHGDRAGVARSWLSAVGTPDRAAAASLHRRGRHHRTIPAPTSTPPGSKPRSRPAPISSRPSSPSTMAVLGRYMARLVALGITERAHFLIGLCPFASARSARWMNDRLFRRECARGPHPTARRGPGRGGRGACDLSRADPVRPRDFPASRGSI